jgi:hypothetical protein
MHKDDPCALSLPVVKRSCKLLWRELYFLPGIECYFSQLATLGRNCPKKCRWLENLGPPETRGSAR